jgi:hypothetical protein
MSFAAAFWISARRGPVAKRCALIAVSVGTTLSLVNQWGAITAGDVNRIPWGSVLANYVVPFIVSNLGAMASLASEKER